MSNARTTAAFTARNIKVFFKDKGAVLSALIAPLVILLLYILFLHGVLESSFVQNMGDFPLDKKLIDGYVASYEVSSILATCCVTVAFVVNMTMVDDKITGVRADIDVAPVERGVLVLGYFFATAIVTLAIAFITLAVGFTYIGIMGWQMSAGDCFLAVADVVLTVLFGTALSSIIASFIKSRGAVMATSTIMSTVYGFISGAYYPISQFASGIANFVMCLPGTYFTGLLRVHFMGGYGEAFTNAGLPDGAVDGILESLDVKLFAFGNAVPEWAMYLVAGVSIALLAGVFVLINAVRRKHKNRVKRSAVAE